MPNIEIHGTYVAQKGNTAYNLFEANYAAMEIREKIKKLFADWACAKEMVVSIVISDVQDMQGKSQPFLRAWDTDDKEGRDIALWLQLSGFDVEFQKLEAFLPKQV